MNTHSSLHTFIITHTHQHTHSSAHTLISTHTHTHLDGHSRPSVQCVLTDTHRRTRGVYTTNTTRNTKRYGETGMPAGHTHAHRHYHFLLRSKSHLSKTTEADHSTEDLSLQTEI